MDNALPRGTELDLNAPRLEPCGLRERGAVLGCELCGASDVGDLGGVQPKRDGRLEPEVERLPDGEGERVTARAELPRSVVDRELGQIGTVVGEEDRAEWCFDATLGA